jgi:plasmid maintenance system antidote protein VapI
MSNEKYILREYVISRATALGWSVYKLAQAAGVNYDSAKRFIDGDRDISGRLLDKLVSAVKKGKRDIHHEETKDHEG